jgi:Holliday junction resolvase RusA-like endonuclease
MDEELLKKGPWKTKARDFEEYQKAISDLLNEQEDDSKWHLGIEVRKSGNPIHQYRVVLTPITP